MALGTNRIKRLQRWLGVPVTGQVDEKTIDALVGEVPGFDEYEARMENVEMADVPKVTEKEYPTVMQRTPNYGGSLVPEGIVFHHSAGSLASNIDWLGRTEAKASYHAIIAKDGARHKFLDLDVVAWHAGESVFKGRAGCNQFMLGIAFTEDTYTRRLTDEEIDSAVQLVKLLAPKYGWQHSDMTDHRTVSPGRKNDLNPVEWRRLQLALKEAF